MKIQRPILIFISLIGFIPSVTAQKVVYKQILKGEIVDKLLQIPVFGASVVLLEDTTQHVLSDINGKFQFDSLPVGKYSLQIAAKDYEATIAQVLLTSGKEEVVKVGLSLQSFHEIQSIAIKGNDYKKEVVNELAPISSHSFTVAETQNYAAAVNDPGRMATSFAGVVGADDGSNALSIRGNSPSGLLWRMEGVDIPAPNHFSSFNGSSGGISLISSQLLGTSDFFTGAFSPEYGNALSGVFDLKMRKGNEQKREHTFRAGVLGIDLATEGPLTNKTKGSENRGSYLVNYRYSTLSILDKMGVAAFSGILNFQDLSFNLAFPKSKIGEFTFFGMGGLSSQNYKNEKDSLLWKSSSDRYSFRFKTNTGIVGLTHTKNISKKTNWRNVLAVSGNTVSDITDYTRGDYTNMEVVNETVAQKKVTLNSVFTKRFNKHHTLRTGVYLHLLGFSSLFKEKNIDSNTNHVYGDVEGSTAYAQSFVQWKYQPHRKLIFLTGAHYMILKLNNKQSIEPRFSVVYKPKINQTLSFGSGLHSQMQLPAIYFTQSAGSQTNTNRNLDFSRAAHFVLGYEIWLTKNWRTKIETYFQHLYKIPVSKDSTSNYSTLNMDWGIEPQDLVNKGLGRNKGVELTVERQFDKGVYALLSGSYYKSEYKTLRNVWYDTRFNGGFALSISAGKEKIIKTTGNALGINFKTSWYGGLRETPVDIAASKMYNTTIRDENRVNQSQLPNYFRLDLKFTYKVNHKKFNSFWSLDLQNATNRKNIGGRFFDIEKLTVKDYYLTPLLPILSYKIEF